MLPDQLQSQSNSPRNATAIAALLLWAAPLCAQSNPTPAPLPALVTTAHKIFLGNAGETDNEDCLRAYNEFYAGLSADGRYQIVLDPATADLVLELHYEIRPGKITGPHSDVGTSFARQFRLILIDPHTHTLLWNLTETENNAIFESNRNRNLDTAVAHLLADFKALNQSASAASASTTKSSPSDKGKKYNSCHLIPQRRIL
jgi:hypothetical protein